MKSSEGSAEMKTLVAAIVTFTLTTIAAAQVVHRGETFRSNSGRYVIKERSNLPCLIDTKTGKEQVFADDTGGRQLAALGFPADDNLQINPPWLLGPVIWHPMKDIVAFSVLLQRRASTVWVWNAATGLHKIAPGEIAKLVGFGKPPENGAPVLSATAKKWNRDMVLIEVASNAPGPSWMGTTLLSYDAVKGNLTVKEPGTPEDSSEGISDWGKRGFEQSKRESQASSGSDSNNQRLTKFTNQKYGCAILVPLDVFPNPPQKPDDEHTMFLSTDGRTMLELVVDQNHQKRAVAEVYRDWIARCEKKGAIGYKTLKGNWFVVSGDANGRGYYTKCVGRDNKLFIMNIEYDEDADAIRENTMTTMSRNFTGR
jgi:hypothetical protein